MKTTLLSIDSRPFYKQTIRLAHVAVVTGCLIALGQSSRAQAPAAASTPLDQSFPEKVGTYARASAKKSAAPSTGGATDSAEAKYTAGSGEITWTATAFATAEEAQAMLGNTIANLEKEGAKVATAIKNAEGKVRFAILETKQGPTYCWVNKKQKNLMYMVTGKAPDVSKFIELQTTW